MISQIGTRCLGCVLVSMVLSHPSAADNSLSSTHPEFRRVAVVSSVNTRKDLQQLKRNYTDRFSKYFGMRMLRAQFDKSGGESIKTAIEALGLNHGTDSDIALPSDHKLVFERPNYSLPYVLVGIEQELYDSVKVAMEPVDLRSDGPMRSATPLNPPTSLVIGCVANLIAASRTTFDETRIDKKPSQLSNLWTYSDFGIATTGYDPDIGVCSSVFTGLQSAVRMGLLEYEETSASKLYYGSTKLSHETLIGRLADVCAWTLVEASQLQPDPAVNPNETDGDVRSYIVSSIVATSAQATPELRFAIDQVISGTQLSPVRDLSQLRSVNGTPNRIAYGASSLGFSIVSASDLLARILDRNRGKDVGRLKWKQSQQRWQLASGVASGHIYTFQSHRNGSGPLAIRMWQKQPNPKELSADLNELVFQLANQVVSSLTSKKGDLRQMKDKNTLTVTYKLVPELYSCYRFFKSIGSTEIVGAWPYYSDFVQFFRSDFSSKNADLETTGSEFWGLILIRDDAPLFTRPKQP